MLKKGVLVSFFENLGVFVISSNLGMLISFSLLSIEMRVFLRNNIKNGYYKDFIAVLQALLLYIMLKKINVTFDMEIESCFFLFK